MNTKKLIALENGLYIDALVTTSDNKVLFLSVWGRDGMMQHFFASLTLPLSEGGLRAMTIELPNREKMVLDFSQSKELTKRSARVPRFSAVGEWVNTWLTHPIILKPSGQSMTIVSEVELTYSQLWPILKNLCHLPLLESWKEPLQFSLMRFVKALPSYSVFAYAISLPVDEIEQLIHRCLMQGMLPLEEIK